MYNINILYTYKYTPNHIKITHKLYTIVIVCLLAFCFVCRMVSLGLFFTEMQRRKCTWKHHAEGREYSHVSQDDNSTLNERALRSYLTQTRNKRDRQHCVHCFSSSDYKTQE